jgi:hypothetical protein
MLQLQTLTTTGDGKWEERVNDTAYGNRGSSSVSGSQGSQARGTSSSSAVSKILKGEYDVLVILRGMSGLCEVYWKGVWK